MAGICTDAVAQAGHSSAAIPVRVDCRDPAAELDVIAQLRTRPEVTIAGPRARPAVLLAVMDGTGDDELQWLRARHASSGVPVVMIVARVDPGALVGLVESGVCGVLSRVEATAERLVRAVQLAAAGQGDLPPALVRHLLDHIGQRGRRPAPARGLPAGGLTRREQDILRLMADGLSTREVAERLAYSERTIKWVLGDLMVRMRVRNRTQAVACAVRNGWI
jgi:DNA-binding NarL/FixJ family response regulator